MSLQFENAGLLWGLMGVLLLALLQLRTRALYPKSFCWRRFTLSLLAFTLCVVALARPQLGHQVARKRGLKGNLFIAIDISQSMVATDVPPTRLGFAVAFATQVIKALEGAKVALFPFALDGYLMMPLTSDTTVATDMLATLTPQLTTNQGSDLSMALEQLLRQILKMESEATERDEAWPPSQVLLLSDGESHTPVREDIVRQFRSRSIPIFTVAVGTAAGSRIPVSVQDPTFQSNLGLGRMVVTKADPAGMQRISRLSGGDYFPPVLAESVRAAQRIRQTMQLGMVSSSFKVEREFYPWLFGIALLLFAAEFLFGRWEYAIRMLLIGLAASPLYAETGSAPPYKDDERRAVDLYNEAVELAPKNANKAIELLQESSQITKQKELKKKALYNLGNTYLRMMDPGQAISSYQQARDIRTGNTSFDKESDQRISENLVLATKIQEQIQKMAQEQKRGEGKEQDPQQDPQDPKGPKTDYEPQHFDEKQKQRMYDLMTSEEQQIQQRLMQEKWRNQKPQRTGKPW